MLQKFLNKFQLFIAVLLVIVIIVMLLWPAELTDERLAQVKVGLTLEQVTLLLGEPGKKLKGWAYACQSENPGKYYMWFQEEKMWNQEVGAVFPYKFLKPGNEDYMSV